MQNDVSDYNNRKNNQNMESDQQCSDNQNRPIPITKETSMSTLIVWNISKAFEKNPKIDLKSAIKAAEQHLEYDSHELSSMISQDAEVRHLACALLAWQQLGHSDAESLYEFIETKQKEPNDLLKSFISSGRKEDLKEDIQVMKSKDNLIIIKGEESKNSKRINCSSFDTFSQIGPVVRLPTDTKIVMRMENTPKARPAQKRLPKQDKETMNKIDAACCLDSGCVERLSTLDAATTELRMRAARLARREAERVELLERAEAAWRDLELGYQRRLNLAEEKEDDMTKQIQRLIEERNGYKNACTVLVQQLKSRGELAEKERERLTHVEKEVCDRACVRLRLSEESARGDSALAEQQCKASQLDRDLQFKEEQVRRKLLTAQSEVESARALTHEAERALRAELGALRDQIAQVSAQLLEEDTRNSVIKEELNILRQEKMGMVEDLEGCKVMCDNRMQGKIDELKKKRDQLNELKEKVIECRCKLPVDATVEVKRTPSLAALCRCTPEEKILDSCSCTSLRSSLLSNLLADLFGGLQAELGGSGSQMPCQLLKCLEDRHNWDRASIVKTNLRNFFSQLLIGELDIAIATSIEKYHAKWVGATCADAARLIPDPGEDENEGWQQRAIERRAQALAARLAEQLFQERAEQLVQRAKEIVSSGPPPCACKPPEHAMFPCLVNAPMISVNGSASSNVTAPAYWKRTIHDVTQLRLQIDDLKKESITKEDLKLMEEKMSNIVQLTNISSPENVSVTVPTNNINILDINKNNKKESRNHKSVNTEPIICKNRIKKSINNNKKQIESYIKKGNKNTSNQLGHTDRQSNKLYKRIGQSFAVNLCLCDSKKDPRKLVQGNLMQNTSLNDDTQKPSWKQKSSKDTLSQMSSLKQTKPIAKMPSREDYRFKDNKIFLQSSCHSDCACFHKMPSNTSIDKFLETLVKWKCVLTDSKDGKCKIETGKKFYDETMNGDNNTDVILSNKSSPSKKTAKESHILIMSSNQINETVNKSTEFERDIPTVTQSEYIGAINLEKSNENFCIVNFKNKDEKEEVNESITVSNEHYKCFQPCKCNKNGELTNQELNTVDKFQKLSHEDEKFSPVLLKDISDNDMTLEIVIDQLTKTSEEMDMNNSENNEPDVPVKDENGNRNSDSDHIVKTSKLFSSDCDYYIKFLGVTLTNINSEEALKDGTTKNKIYNDDSYLPPSKQSEEHNRNLNEQSEERNKNLHKQSKERNKQEHKYLNKSQFKSLIKSNDYTKENSEGYNEITTCQCNIKLDELKKIIGSVYNKRCEEYSINDDKALDVQSFKNKEVEGDEPCICCGNLDEDESNNLELNTFHLIENHLKEKLQEFKVSFCKSSCIPVEEEEKLFSVILDRVKKVISESTNKITCVCRREEHLEGNWNRAYSLLQEYLKVKIKRVQCLCVSSEKEKDTILPGVLDKVCNLIENDFQRLKDICRCKTTINSEQKTINMDDEALYETPEKDTNKNDSYVYLTSSPVLNRDNIDKMSKQNSNNSIFLTQTMSSQVPPNLGMESKSCDAMEKGIKCIQTEETENTVAGSSNILKVIKAGSVRCFNSTEKKKPVCLEIYRANEVLVNHCANVVNQINDDVIVKKCPDSKDSHASNITKCSQSLSLLPENQRLEQEIIKTEDNPDIVDKIIQPKQITLPYIGYTIDCSCGNALNSCVCVKSMVQANNYTIDRFWKTLTKKSAPIQNISYIMNNIPNRIKTENMKCIEVTEYANNKLTCDHLVRSSNVCEIKISAHNEEEIVLKDSRGNVDQTNDTTNTCDDNKSLGTEYLYVNDPIEWYECRPLSPPFKNQPANDKVEDSLYYPIDNILKHHKRSEEKVNSDTMKLPQNCECNMVPICHVKMLIENIENKLMHSKCTCDSLNSKVCPVHSKSYFY